MTIFTKTLRSFLFCFINIWAVSGSVLCPPASAQPSFIEILHQQTHSIVTVQAQKPDRDTTVQNNDGKTQVLEKTGAGIIIDPAGYIVTNTHTILYAEFIFATLYNGQRLPATIASVAPNSDFTILKVEPPFPLKPLPWSDGRDLRLGADIVSIGNSALWKETMCGGKITGLANHLSQDTVGLIEMDLDLDRGDSGGPVLDTKGNFLGIIIAKNTRVGRSSYALPASQIRSHFQKYLNESLGSHE